MSSTRLRIAGCWLDTPEKVKLIQLLHVIVDLARDSARASSRVLRRPTRQQGCPYGIARHRHPTGTDPDRGHAENDDSDQRAGAAFGDVLIAVSHGGGLDAIPVGGRRTPLQARWTITLPSWVDSVDELLQHNVIRYISRTHSHSNVESIVSQRSGAWSPPSDGTGPRKLYSINGIEKLQ